MRSYIKGVGQGLVVVGAILGLDSAGMGNVEGAFGAAVGITAMLFGVVLIRLSKPKT
jgi:hypothetical protein